jgi:hypothetical protein
VVQKTDISPVTSIIACPNKPLKVWEFQYRQSFNVMVKHLEVIEGYKIRCVFENVNQIIQQARVSVYLEVGDLRPRDPNPTRTLVMV